MERVASGKQPRPEDDLSAAMQICAGKLNLLNLIPIKKRLGTKWPRLRDLIHQLFERALRNVQGPQDSFIRIGEVAYVATFHGCSHEEAVLCCASVAKQVCALVFGEQDEDVTLKSVVGPVPGPIAVLTTMAADRIISSLDTTGVETLHFRSAPELSGAKTIGTTQSGLRGACELASACGYAVGFFPVWELAKNESKTLLIALYTRTDGRPAESATRALGLHRELDALELEVALLGAAGEYSRKIHDAQGVCGLTVGVSHDTLMTLSPRIRYITALKALKITPTCPILLKIEQVPSTIPSGRLAELLAMLKMPGLRTIVEFDNPRSIPSLDASLATVGLAAVIAQYATPQKSLAGAQMLVRRAKDRPWFTCLAGLDSEGQVQTARGCGVRFGLGKALSGAPLTGFEPVPAFPLHRSRAERVQYLPC